jgi:tellurite resistance protein TehA-like permease
VRKLFAVLASLFALSAVLQLYFAALGEFSNKSDDLFNIHGTNGRYILPALGLLVIVGAALARAGRNTIVLAVVAFVLIYVQTGLFILAGLIFNVSEESANKPIGASILLGFHGLVGLSIIVLSAIIAQRAWKAGFPMKARAMSGTKM